MNQSPKILFIHGLESRANGSKTLMLREQGFDVSAHEMNMGVYQISRQNSVLRSALRQPEVRLMAGALTLGLFASARSFSWRKTAGSVLLGVSWASTRRGAILSRALRESFEACVSIQQDALSQEAPDVVIGSSWGGAVAFALMRRGLWSGPTILLAPAVHRVWERANLGSPSDDASALRERGQKTLIFHDPSDATVPFEDSEALSREANFELRSVDAGGHRLMGLLHSGQLAQTLREM